MIPSLRGGRSRDRRDWEIVGRKYDVRSFYFPSASVLILTWFGYGFETVSVRILTRFVILKNTSRPRGTAIYYCDFRNNGRTDFKITPYVFLHEKNRLKVSVTSLKTDTPNLFMSRMSSWSSNTCIRSRARAIYDCDCQILRLSRWSLLMVIIDNTGTSSYETGTCVPVSMYRFAQL